MNKRLFHTLTLIVATLGAASYAYGAWCNDPFNFGWWEFYKCRNISPGYDCDSCQLRCWNACDIQGDEGACNWTETQINNCYAGCNQSREDDPTNCMLRPVSECLLTYDQWAFISGTGENIHNFIAGELHGEVIAGEGPAPMTP